MGIKFLVTCLRTNAKTVSPKGANGSRAGALSHIPVSQVTVPMALPLCPYSALSGIATVLVCTVPFWMMAYGDDHLHMPLSVSLVTCLSVSWARGFVSLLLSFKSCVF